MTEREESMERHPAGTRLVAIKEFLDKAFNPYAVTWDATGDGDKTPEVAYLADLESAEFLAKAAAMASPMVWVHSESVGWVPWGA